MTLSPARRVAKASALILLLLATLLWTVSCSGGSKALTPEASPAIATSPAPSATPAPAQPPAPEPAQPVPTPGVVSAADQIFVTEAVVPINDRIYGPASLQLLLSAQKSIHICLYQVRHYTDYPGSVSNQLVDSLILARQRGCDVQVILDSTPWRQGGDHNKENELVATRLARSGCSVWFDPPEIQSHQKCFIVDGRVAVVASANWSHFSLANNREVAVAMWGDDIAAAYQDYFAQRLTAAVPYAPPAPAPGETLSPIEPQVTPLPTAAATTNRPPAPEPEALARQFQVPIVRGATVQLLNNRDFYPRLDAAMRQAARSIDVVQDYALYYHETPRREGVTPPANRPSNLPSLTNQLFEDLVSAKQRDLRVRAVFNYGVNEEGTSRFSDDYAHRLLALGVEAFRDSPEDSIHAKMLLIDDEAAVVGSTNWSYDAVELNNECSVIVRSPQIGAHYRQWVDSILARSTPAQLPAPTPAPQPTPTPANEAVAK